MKCTRRGRAIVVGALGAAMMFSTFLTVRAQQATTPQASTPQTGAAQSAAPAASEPTPHGKVIFSRSLGEPEKNQTSATDERAGTKATDTERSAVTYTSYDLDVRLRPEEHALAVSAQVTIRNDGERPLAQIPMQVSSTLQWESIESAGKKLTFAQSLIKSDADHSGQVREAVIVLSKPLEPKAEIKLKVIYSGQVEKTAKRLEDIGTPEDLASHSDWDEVGANFVGLRGFGNVLWYPGTSAPVVLGDGARLFTEIGRQKLRQTPAKVSMQVVAEFFGEAPNLAVLNGHVVPVVRTASPEASFPGVVTCSLPAATIGFASPTLFLLRRAEQDQSNVQIYARAEDQANTSAYLTAASSAAPVMQEWLGAKPRLPLVMVDLADPDDVPFEEGNVLFTGMGATDPQQVAGAMSHAWSHAYFQSSRAWLDEGVAQFMGSVWNERSRGRDVALEQLEATRSTLALTEPADPGAAPGETLVNASDTAYYRIKASYVLWMLRDLASDAALSAALRAYVPAEDTRPEYFEELLERTSGKNLRWFFDSWVYQDRGLPDLAIASVFPTRGAGAGQYLVAVDVANDGYADTEVPVTVRSQSASLTERVRVLGRSKTTHRFLIDGTPTEVVLNDGSIPEVQASVHQQALTVAANKP
jgi:hypothetical protein